MADRFKLYHLKSAGDSQLKLPEGYWHLTTCLRSIVITGDESRPESLNNHQFMGEEEAYEFLLKVICGLDSPLLGETEILGQFKEFAKKHESDFSAHIRDLVYRLLRDAKNIRKEFLQNLGCTSYGSLLRKELKGEDAPVTLVGAGSLAQDILPWFAKWKQPLQVFTRDPKKYQDLKAKQENIDLRSFAEMQSFVNEGILVVAAPLSSAQLNELFDLESYAMIYDLRGDSHRDTLNSSNVTTLKALFDSIETNKKQAAVTKKNAVTAIKKFANHLSLLERPRPFGWEDLWTYS